MSAEKGGDRAFARLRGIDPNYGSQEHQRGYIDRLDECHRRAVCLADHEHSFKCYPEDVVRAVNSEAARQGVS